MSLDISILVSGLKEIGGMVGKVFDFAGKGKLDQTEAMRQYYALALKIRDVEALAYQAQSAIKEKLMVGARWTQFMTLLTGCSLVGVCVFNVVMRTLGLSANVDLFSHEVGLLAALFLFSASGSAELLVRVIGNLIEAANKKREEVKP